MKKLRKQTNLGENSGKLALDLGKLIFGAIFLGGILRGEVPNAILVIGGLYIAFLFFIVGLWLTTKEKTKEKE